MSILYEEKSPHFFCFLVILYTGGLMNCHEFSCFLSSLTGCELVAVAGLFSVAIANNLNPNEIDMLGNFFSALGSNLSTIAAVENPDCLPK